ncbi:MAG: metallophosphoesterase [Halobacteriaceae archaeon]
MDIGFISDIHSNKIALEAVLDDMPDVDAILCAGDIIGYGPWPGECVDIIQRRANITISGNHDRVLVEGSNFRGNAMARAGIKHAREELSESQRNWLASLPAERSALDDQIHLVHGHPDDPDRYTYPEDFSPELLQEKSILAMGHTHVQHVEEYGEGIVLNPGSVGQPRDGDPRAAYAIIDVDEMVAEPRRVGYDIDRVIDAVATAGLPARNGERLKEGR